MLHATNNTFANIPYYGCLPMMQTNFGGDLQLCTIEPYTGYNIGYNLNPVAQQTWGGSIFNPGQAATCYAANPFSNGGGSSTPVSSGIPTPGVNTSYFRLLLASNGTLGMFNALSGNGLQSLSITMLSITPYITSSIILQLMCSIIPSLGEVQKDGETGRKKFKMYTVVLGAVLAAIESVGFAVGFGQRGLLLSYKWYWVLCVSAIWFF